MSERLNTAPERAQPTPELKRQHSEKLAELKEAFKTSAEAAPETSALRADLAREVIQRQAEQVPAPAAENAPAAPVRPNFLNHHLNFSQTLSSVQRKLPGLSRTFSAAIHAPAVEKASEVLESTVARPSVLLGTTWTALIVGTAFYLTARHYGYALSGSELLFSFIVGALLGISGEGLWKLLRRR